MSQANCATQNHSATLDVKLEGPRNLLVQGFSKLVSIAIAQLQRRRQRAAFRKLLAADDRILKDIGVTRGDVHWASQLPLQVNAGEELRLYSRRYPRKN